MQICKPILFGMVLALGGCMAAFSPFGLAEPVDVIELKQGIYVKGPSGYCIDPKSSRNDMAVLFSCARLTDLTAVDPTEGNIFTVTALDGTLEATQDFGAFLKSDPGLSFLSGGPSAKEVNVNSVKTSAKGVYAEFTDPNRPTHLGTRVWRGFVKARGKIMIISLYQGYGDPIRGASGEQRLRKFASILSALNN